MKSLFCIAVICITFTSAVKLPSYFSACERNDGNLNDCIKESGNKGMADFLKGDPKTHVVPLLPLHIDEMYIDVDGNLKINITNADASGLDTAQLETMNWDWDNKKILFDVRIDKPVLTGTYDIAGRILILPINGQGPCNITYVNGLFKFEFNYEMEERNNEEYVKVVDGKMKYDVDRAYFQLDNLFNGDPKLGEEMSKFLDENWKEVNGEIGVRVGDALAQVFLTIIKSFLGRVPMSHLWG